MGPAVRLRSAVALVGRFPVLAGVDLDVARGEVVLLQGPNGAGKTSVLRACAGLLPVVSGTAEVLGHDLVADRRAARRHTGLFGHATALYDDLSVLDNVRFAVRAAKGSLDRVDPTLATLGLTGRLRTAPVGTLSAGQRRRTALAALVAAGPALWLLDEPHAGLDADHRDLLDHLVRQAAAEGTTVLLASHEQERATKIADRVVTVAGGMVTDAGRSPADEAGEAAQEAGIVRETPAHTTSNPTVRGAAGNPRSAGLGPGGGAVGEAQPRHREPSTEPKEPADVG